jgi:diketogulonate reductase-like aldo/keto reductase
MLCSRLVDSAQAYRNEAHVGQGLRDTSVSRNDVFIGMDSLFASARVFC